MLWVSVYKQNMVWYQMLIVFDNWLMFDAIDTNPVFVDTLSMVDVIIVI